MDRLWSRHLKRMYNTMRQIGKVLVKAIRAQSGAGDTAQKEAAKQIAAIRLASEYTWKQKPHGTVMCRPGSGGSGGI